MNKKVIACIVILVSIIIMLMPVSVKMSFAGENAVSYYSYFSMMPAGYGNYMPLLTGCISVCALIASVLNLKKNTARQTMFLLIICINLNLFSWFIFSTFTFAALIVFLLHIAAMGLLKN